MNNSPWSNVWNIRKNENYMQLQLPDLTITASSLAKNHNVDKTQSFLNLEKKTELWYFEFLDRKSSFFSNCLKQGQGTRQYLPLTHWITIFNELSKIFNQFLSYLKA